MYSKLFNLPYSYTMHHVGTLAMQVTDIFGALFHTQENIDSFNWCLSNSKKCKQGIPDIKDQTEATQSFAKLDNDQCCVT